MRQHLAVSLSLSLALAACGGGGGSPATPPAPRLSLSTTTLSFHAPAQGPAPAAQVLTGTISGEPANVFVLVTQTNRGIAEIPPPAISGDSASSAVSARPPAELGHGVYSDTITVRACPDPACATQFAGSPATVNVTYSVGIPVAPAAVTASSVEGTSAPSQTLALSHHGGSSAWTASASTTDGGSWLQPAASGAALPANVQVAFGPMPAGAYAGTINIAVGGESRAVPVQYTVLPLLSATEIAPILVANGLPASGRIRSATISSRLATRQVPWTATTAVPWLDLTVAAGTTGGTQDILSLQLDPEAVMGMPNGEYEAIITLASSAPGVTPIELPVALRLDRTHLDTVAPYVIGAGTAGKLVLRGERFGEGPIDGVMLGDVAVTSFTQFGTDRIEVQHPALAAGRYPVRLLRDPGDPIGSSAELVVMPASDYVAGGASAAPTRNGLVVFDAERKSFYMLSSDNGVEAIRREGSGWTSQLSSATWPFVTGAALSADGKQLVLYGNGTDMIHLNPVTLTEIGRASVEIGFGATLPYDGLVTLDTGRLLYAQGGQLFTYHLQSGASAPTGDPLPYVPYLHPTPSGNRVFTGDGGQYHVHASGSSTFPVAPQAETVRAALADRLGQRWAFVEEPSTTPTPEVIVTNGTLQTLGRIPIHVFMGGAALSQDGRWLYLGYEATIVGSSATSGDYHVRVYDLSQPPVSGVYPLARRIDLPAGVVGPMFLAPDEQELLVLTSAGIRAVDLR